MVDWMVELDGDELQNLVGFLASLASLASLAPLAAAGRRLGCLAGLACARAGAIDLIPVQV